MADTSTALPQVTRKGVLSLSEFSITSNKKKPKKVIQKESVKGPVMSVRLIEGDTDPVKTSKFRVVLIREGLGNLGDGYYYSAESLEYAAANLLFEGKKIYANHPSPEEEKEHPERIVEDILGHFENVTLEVDDQGSKFLEADVHILPGPAFDKYRAFMLHQVEYAKKYKNQNFIGLSINAGGEAVAMPIEDIPNVPPGAKPKMLEAMKQGLKEVKYVKKITEAFSVDMVTQAGAGGGVLRLLEKLGPKTSKCVQDIKKKQGSDTDPYNAYAVCTTSVGNQKESQMDHKDDEKKKADVKAAENEEASKQKEDGAMEGDPKQTTSADSATKADGDPDADPKADEGTEKTPDPKSKDKEVKEDAGDDGDESDDDAEDDEDGDGDAEEDKALITKILKDYLDKEPMDATDGEKEAVKEAVKMSKQMYKDDPKEALKCAGYSLKMASHKEKKMAEAKSKESAATSGTVPGAGKPGGKIIESDKKVKTLDVKINEAECTIVKLTSEIATLKAALAKHEIQNYLEKKMKECKLPNQATKLFREKAGELKSKKELDEKLAIFSEAWIEGGKPMSFSLVEEERVVPATAAGTSMSLADCFK